MRIELSAEAQADLAAILDYGVAMFGEAAAEAYLCAFDEAFDMINAHPLVGSAHPVVRPPIRSLRCGSHRLFYDVFDDRIVVQRVLHQAMDVERWL